MSSALLGRILSLISRAGALYGDAAALTLLLAPVAAMLVFFVLRLVWEKCRTAPRRWALALSGACLFLFCALALAYGEMLPASFALASAAAAVHLLFYGLLFIPVSSRDARAAKRAERRRRRADRIKKRAEQVVGEETELPPVPEEPRPPKVRCFSDDDRVTLEKDVRLGHVSAALERLLSLPLGAGDRLEAQKMSDLLAVYRAKGELSGREADALNDVLAAVLKMMAKYDV